MQRPPVPGYRIRCCIFIVRSMESVRTVREIIRNRKKPRYEYGKKKTGQKFIPEYSGFQSNIYIAVFFDLQGFLGSRTGKEDIQVTKR